MSAERSTLCQTSNWLLAGIVTSCWNSSPASGASRSTASKSRMPLAAIPLAQHAVEVGVALGS